MTIQTKRTFDPPSEYDGARILVDRYWPRAWQREAAPIDDWTRELAPSAPLIARLKRRPETWDEFVESYRQELDRVDHQEPLARLRRYAHRGTLTLITGTGSAERGHVHILAGYLERMPIPEAAPAVQVAGTARASTPRRLELPGLHLLEWIGLLFALSTPLIALVTIELLVVFGVRGWIVFLAMLILFSTLTVVRVIGQERTGSGGMARRDHTEAQSLWVAMRDLSVGLASVVAGLLLLALVLAVFAAHAGLHW